MLPAATPASNKGVRRMSWVTLSESISPDSGRRGQGVIRPNSSVHMRPFGGSSRLRTSLRPHFRGQNSASVGLRALNFCKVAGTQQLARTALRLGTVLTRCFRAFGLRQSTYAVTSLAPRNNHPHAFVKVIGQGLDRDFSRRDRDCDVERAC